PPLACPSLVKIPKQVGPLPDIAAARHPGHASNAAFTAPITGSSAIAGGSRSLPTAAIGSHRAAIDAIGANGAVGARAPLRAGACSAANTRAVARGRPGLASTAGGGGGGGGAVGKSWSPSP